jgi:hypothetical protein
MAIEGVGATFSWGTAVAGIVSIGIPDDEYKEYETTSLSDTREQFKLSAMAVGQECTLTVRLDPETPAFTSGDAQTGAVITLPKQTSGSTAGATYTFDGFTKLVSGGTADVASTDGITQEVTIRLTSEVVFVAEA